MAFVNIPDKSEVRSFARSRDNRRYFKNFRQSLNTPTLHLLRNYKWAFVRMDPVNVPAKFDNGGPGEVFKNFGQSLDTPSKVIQGH